MKRLLTISFALFYLLISTGLVLSIHYCGGQVESIGISTTSDPCCCGNDEMDVISCCDTETVVLQIDNDEQISQVQRSLSHDVQAEIAVFRESSFQPADVINKINIRQLDLPPPDKEPLWLLNCNFTYYG